MVNLNDLFNGVQVISAVAIIAFIVFYIVYRKDFLDLQNRKRK